MRKLINEYFLFTKRERIAIIGLMVVILLAYVLPYFIKPPGRAPSAKEVQEFRMMEQQLARAKGTDTKTDNEDEDAIAHAPPVIVDDDESPPARLFYFDPNTISADGWKQLGLRSKTIGTILKYLSKGGRFYDALDLKKIYGLRAEEYARLKRYIRINKPAKGEDAGASQKRTPYYAREEPYQRQSSNNIRSPAKRIIDINTADTTDWINLPGIGSKLAARIVAFRERLGGFYDVEQIRETYGLADSTFQKILPLLAKGNHSIKKININSVNVETLKQHPYIKWNIASAIIRYREQHGPFTSLESLLQIAAITPDVYKKILPYLVIAPD